MIRHNLFRTRPLRDHVNHRLTIYRAAVSFCVGSTDACSLDWIPIARHFPVPSVFERFEVFATDG